MNAEALELLVQQLESAQAAGEAGLWAETLEGANNMLCKAIGFPLPPC